MTAAELPIQTIKNANLGWVRQDLGPMDELIADIRANGIRKPLLIAPDYLMYDGARRLVAAEKLGYKHVPVIICRSWPVLFQAMKDNQVDSYPMNWLELRDLWERVLKQAHEQHRRNKAVATRRRNATRLVDHQASYNYSGYTQDLATIYGVTPATVKILRDSLTRLADAKSTSLTRFRPKIFKMMTEASPRARHMHHGRVLKTILHRLSFGKCSETDALADFAHQINDGPLDRPIQFGRQKRNMLDHAAPLIPMSALENFTDLIEQVAAQAGTFRNFHTTARHRKRYEDLTARIFAATTKFYRLRRRLESVLGESVTRERVPGDEEE